MGLHPLNNIAFSVPTVTTTLAGFSLWVERYAEAEEAPGPSPQMRGTRCGRALSFAGIAGAIPTQSAIIATFAEKYAA